MDMAKLRVARQIVGLSQRELGKKCRLSQGMISAFETGRLVPGPALRKRLAAGLSLPEGDLFPADNKD